MERSSVEVWTCLPALSSSKKGDYTAVPVVSFIPNFSETMLNLNKDEVDQAFCVKFSELADNANIGYTQFRVEVCL